MTGKTHNMAGVALLMTVVVVVPPGKMTVATALAALLANQIGSIVPDVDQPTAPFWRNLAVGRYLGKVFSALIGGHRFLSHSIIGLVLFGVLARLGLEYFQPVMPRIDIDFVWVAFIIGMISHLIMDSFTKEGVPWLLPLPFKIGFPPVKRWRMTTGKLIETAVMFPLLIAVTTWLVAGNYSEISAIVQDRLVR